MRNLQMRPTRGVDAFHFQIKAALEVRALEDQAAQPILGLDGDRANEFVRGVVSVQPAPLRFLPLRAIVAREAGGGVNRRARRGADVFLPGGSQSEAGRETTG